MADIGSAQTDAVHEVTYPGLYRIHMCLSEASILPITGLLIGKRLPKARSILALCRFWQAGDGCQEGSDWGTSIRNPSSRAEGQGIRDCGVGEGPATRRFSALHPGPGLVKRCFQVCRVCECERRPESKASEALPGLQTAQRSLASRVLQSSASAPRRGRHITAQGRDHRSRTLGQRAIRENEP